MPLIADEKLLFESPSPQDIYCYTPAACAAASAAGSSPDSTSADPERRSSRGRVRTRGIIRAETSCGFCSPTTAAQAGAKARPACRCCTRCFSAPEGSSMRSARADGWSSAAVRTTVKAGRRPARARVGTPVAPERRANRFPAREALSGLRTADSGGAVARRFPGPDGGAREADLCDPASWTFSEPFRAEALFDRLAAAGWRHRGGGVPGVLETSVIRIHDPDHAFFDPEDRTVLLLMRAETGSGQRRRRY